MMPALSIRAGGDELRILVLADARGATQAISLLRPLADLCASGGCRIELIDEATLDKSGPKAIEAAWSELRPTGLVLSRYAGGKESAAIAAARKDRIPVIYHIDDDLFAVPKELGPQKFARYNDPQRIANLTSAVAASDVVYASTAELARQLRLRFPDKPVVTGEIFCAHRPLTRGPSATGSPLTIGYMASSGHAQDLQIALPAIAAALASNVDLRFETFGTIRMPPELERFGTRVRHHRAIADYDVFMHQLAGLDWHIGLAPLADTPFNRCKTDTKWVEYTAAGIPVIASNLPVYARACRDGAGLLVGPQEWEEGLQRLIVEDDLRLATIAKAQARLAETYRPERLTQQLLGFLRSARPQPDPAREQGRQEDGLPCHGLGVRFSTRSTG